MEPLPYQPHTLWRLRLFDGPVLEDAAGATIRRFRSQRVGALLAYLALHLDRPCPRETLCDALWPEEALEVASNRLRVTLASLRRQLEPPGVPFGTVLDVGTPGRVILRASAVWCDAAALEQAMEGGRRDAAQPAHGTLLPGYYDEWALTARDRLDALQAAWREERRTEQRRWERREGGPAPSAAGAHEAAASPAADAYNRAAPPAADAYNGAAPPTTRANDAVAPPTAQAGNRTEPPTTRANDAAAPPTAGMESGLTPAKRLPLYLTRFFGREAERRQLRAMVQANRLVTLTGPGGIGKTRLAVETAAEMPWACLLVPLADLPSPERVPEALLQALLISPQAQSDPVAQLVEALRRRDPAVLILDNAEHLLDAVAALSLRLLAEVPSLRLLVTGRRRLDLPGEAVLTLEPLEPPPHASAAARLEEFPAVALFLDRARNVRPDFTLNARQEEALVEICRRLEGVPLALELAAARVTAQTPEQIAASLAADMMGLKSRQRGLPERHRSLRAAIYGSFDLLTPELQTFVAQLSVFQGGWTVEAARAVTGEAGAEEALEELALRSLVVVREEAGAGTMRYSFLETMRRFAAEQLPADSAQRAAGAPCPLFSDAGGRRRRGRPAHPPAAGCGAGEPARRPRCGAGRDRTGSSGPGWQAPCCTPSSAGTIGAPRTGSTAPCRWSRQAPEPALRFRVRYAACQILPDSGRFREAGQTAREMQADALAHHNPVHTTHAEVILGFLEEARGHFETAAALQQAALQRARTLADLPLLLACLSHTSGALHGYGAVLGAETAAGRAALQESEALARELIALAPPHSRRVSLSYVMTAASLFFLQRYREAEPLLQRGQTIAIAHGAMTERMFALAYRSDIARIEGAFEQAALLFGAFLNLQERMGYSLERAQSFRPAWLQELTVHLQAALGHERCEALVRQGRRTPPEALPTDPGNLADPADIAERKER